MDLRAYLDTDGTWRVDHVPICTTGIEYPLSTGPMTFTEDHISDIILSQGDPAVKAPRLKLGHSSEYNAVLIGDAEQAFGRVANLTVEDLGQTIYGDYVGMPEWLAKVVAIAFPNRSIEGWPDVKTNTGHEYRAVVSAVSLLGVQWPGISTLEDLPLYYGAEIPPGVVIDSELGTQDLLNAMKAKNGGGMEPGERIKAAVDIDLVARAFYTEIATGDNYWWWIRGERYDDATGLQLIVDCDGSDDMMLCRIPVSVSGSDISFGDPVEVTEEYPDKTPVAASAFVAGMMVMERQQGADMIMYASRADTTQDRPAIRATQGGEAMDDATRQALATRVGLDPETATEDEINATIDELRGAGEGGDDKPNGDEPNGDDTPPTQAGAGNGAVLIDAERLAHLEAGASTALELQAAERARADEEVLAGAIRAGKFSPARKGHYAALLKSDPEGARQLIAELHEGTIPMEERGGSGNGGGGLEAGNGGGEGLPDEWFGTDMARIKAGKVPGRVSDRIMNAREA